MFPLHIITQDKTPLTAHLFEPQTSNGKMVIINSATGVRQHIYFGIARFLSENGFTVITYDYRGIGLSKPNKITDFQASMRLWGTQDFSAITDYVNIHFPNDRKYVIGHSVGALILGMNKDSIDFENFVFVATQKAYVKNLTWKIQLMAYLGFGILQPLLTKIFGYFPAHWLGLGERLPAGVAFDWRTLILNPKSTNRLLEKIEEDFSKQLKQKPLVISAEDDAWVTEKGLQTLMNETYPNMQPTYRHLKKSESEKGEIGHINFFRSYNQKLWQIILNEFNG